jgi:hypothetical protein
MLREIMTQITNPSFRRFFAGPFAGLLLACCGCGDSGTPPVSASTAEATVHGKVTLDGKAPTGGMISFDPSNIARKDAKISSAKIGEDGTYTIKTLVGENKITVESAETKKAMYNIDVFDAKGGDNTHDVALTKQ